MAKTPLKTEKTLNLCVSFSFKITVQTPNFSFYIQCVSPSLSGNVGTVAGQLKLFHCFCPHITEDRDHDVFQSFID